MTNWHHWFFTIDINDILDEENNRLKARHAALGVMSTRIFCDFSHGGEPGSYTMMLLGKRPGCHNALWPRYVIRRGALYEIPADTPPSPEGCSASLFATPLDHNEALEVIEAVTIHCHYVWKEPVGYGYKLERWTPEGTYFEPPLLMT